MWWTVISCLVFMTISIWWRVCCFDMRVFDVVGLPIESYMYEAGPNRTIPCPGLNEHFLVSHLVWLSVSHQTKMVEFNHDTVIVWGDQLRITLESFGLTFNPAYGDDSGDYICLVNGRPRPDKLVRLIIQDVPDPPGRPLIVSFTSRSVDLSWAPPLDTHHSAITHYVVHTRLGEDGDWNDIPGILTPNNETYMKVTDLEPYTVYSFRVLAVNGMGASTPSVESYYMVTLREAPSGKPIITTAHNKSGNSIHLSWRPPPADTIHGEFLGYRITYRPRESIEGPYKEVYIRDPSVETHTIEDLETYTQYLVSLQVFNPEGHGPNTTVLVMTDEGVPSKPLNVTVIGITSSSIELGWAEPAKTNGAIEGYYIYYINSNYTDVATYRLHGNTPKLRYNLKNLKPHADYKLWVKAFTKKYDGLPSDPVYNYTDVDGPSEPMMVNLTCKSDDAIRIQWKIPEIFYNTLDYYYIYINGDDLSENITLPATYDETNTFIVPNVSLNTDYHVRLAASTRSKYFDELKMGKLSNEQTITMFPNCDKIQAYIRGTFDDLNAGMMAGLICAGFAIIMGITAFLIWTKCFRTIYQYYHRARDTDWNGPIELNGEIRRPIPVAEFKEHVRRLHADGDLAFSKEFELIQSEASRHQFTYTASEHPNNKPKNRYLNIHAYDHTRVTLKRYPGDKKWMDYINANYIDGFQWPKAYIGTQGPLPSTFDDFWRMVWEQRVSIIVMITNLVERGKQKCDMYWPKEGKQTYGIIEVTLLNEDVYAAYTVRTLQLKYIKRRRVAEQTTEVGEPSTSGVQTTAIVEPVPVEEQQAVALRDEAAAAVVPEVPEVVVDEQTVENEEPSNADEEAVVVEEEEEEEEVTERIVHQYHYTGWPDHGTADHPLSVLEFIKKSSAANPPGSGPLVVHCSAGVGRTGAYIVIDAMLKMIRSRDEVNIFGFLRHIRKQRHYLVQTEEQYIFIHESILEAIQAGETCIARDKFLRYLDMQQTNSIEERTLQWKSLAKQFDLIASYKPLEYQLAAAKKPMNVRKNRGDILPTEDHRVHITPKPAYDGSDYINASWMPGYDSLREFIIAEHPLPNTVMAFWQMIWDHNAQAIVLLSAIDSVNFGIFWPLTPDAYLTDSFKVRLTHESVEYNYVVRHFLLQSIHDEYEFPMKIIQCSNWPNNCTTINELFEFTDTVQKIIGIQNGPVVVVDRFGGIDAGMFCILTTLKKEVSRENVFDIYSYCKLYQLRRPRIWPNIDVYLKFHYAAKLLCTRAEVPDVYITMSNGAAAALNGTVTNDCVRVPPEETPLITTREVYSQSCSSSSSNQYCIAHL